MKLKEPALTKPSEPEKVDAYMRGLTPPLAKGAGPVRKSVFSLRGRDEAAQSKGVQTIPRGLQPVPEGLHSSGISQRSPRELQVGTTGRRLCRREKAGTLPQHGRGDIQEDSIAISDQGMA